MTIARAFQILIFIFLLLNITFSANNWFVGIVFYFIALVIGSFVLINSKYLFSSILIICLVVLTQVLEAISPDQFI